jgi:hypothetical protein
VIGPTCDCCTSPLVLVPVERDNPSKLSAVAFRLGTFAAFRHSILHQIARTPELRALRSRADDDFSVTLIDLWATVADVLTFYQERIANEGFLGTATQRDSVLRLARLLDYELRPGTAATTLLVFTLEPGARLTIPIGTRVKSVPVATEKPQTFETRAAIEADARLNALRVAPMPTRITPLEAGRGHEIVMPGPDSVTAASAFAPGDTILAIATAGVAPLALASRTLDGDQVGLTWATPAPPGLTGDPVLYKAGRTFRLWGADAPASAVVVENPTTPATTQLVVKNIVRTLGAGSEIDLEASFPDIAPGARLLLVGSTGTRVVTVATTTTARVTLLNAGVSGSVTRLGVRDLDGQAIVLSALGANAEDVVVHELTSPPVTLWPYDYPARLTGPELLIHGQRTGFDTVEIGRTLIGKIKPGIALEPAALPPRRRMILGDGQASPVATTVVEATIIDTGVRFLPTDADAGTVRQLGIAPDQVRRATHLVGAVPAAALRNARPEIMVTIGEGDGVVAELTGLPSGPLNDAAIAPVLEAAIRAARQASPTYAKARVRAREGHLAIGPGVPSDPVAVAPTAADPTTATDLGFGPGAVLWLDATLSAPFRPRPAQIAGDLIVQAGLFVTDNVSTISAGDIPAGASPTAAANELQTAIGLDVEVIEDRFLIYPALPTEPPRAFVAITVRGETPFDLDGTSATMYGNVGPAGHGEQVQDEVMGDGDASVPFQHFRLRKAPVTQGPAAGPGGAASSLQVLVDGVLWSEVPTLYGMTNDAEVYRTRIADDGSTTVEFGDGRMGRRLPTGRANVVARYRKGLGLAGRVGAARIATLLDRPTGLKAVRNPLRSDGGSDPEVLATARSAAPRTVLTFDRIVSLRDVEAVATATGEVARASATWVWSGARRAIHLTVAGPGGAPFLPSGRATIADRLDARRDPNHRLLIENVIRLPFRLAVRVDVEPRYVRDDVGAAVRSALVSGLSFEALAFGQDIATSDIYALVQAVAGVRSSIVLSLDLKSGDPDIRADHGLGAGPGERIRVMPAHPDPDTFGLIIPAEQAWLEIPDQDIRLEIRGGLEASA